MPITAADVLAAAERIRGRVRRTPVVRADVCGLELYIKAENLQDGGSFKLRGATNFVQTLDAAALAGMSRDLEQRMAALVEKVYEAAGGPFNVLSPLQLRDILFTRLGLPSKGIKKTKTGASTDQEVLEQLALQHPLPSLLLTHRVLTKLKGTYLDALPAMINPDTGKIHTSFNQVAAEFSGETGSITTLASDGYSTGGTSKRFPGYGNQWDQILYRDLQPSAGATLNISFLYRTQLSKSYGTTASTRTGWFHGDPLAVTSGNFISSSAAGTSAPEDSFMV